MVDFNSYYGNYGRYAGVSPAYGGYDYLLKTMSDNNKGSLFTKVSETQNTTEPSTLKTCAKVGVAVALGTGLVLLLKGKGKQAIDLMKKPFQGGKISEIFSKITKKAPVAV